MPASKPNPNATVCLVGALIFGLFGLLLFPRMLWMRVRAEDMLKWPLAEAEIVATGTRETYRKGQGTRYQHKLTYHFVVQNQNYIGDRVAYGGQPREWQSEADARKALPTIGSKLQIRFNPRDPSDSVIRVFQTSDWMTDLVLWVFGGVAAASAALVTVAGIAWWSGNR